jgi:fructose-1,6-bisphosphatase/inositol monophosphatase family enzyme
MNNYVENIKEILLIGKKLLIENPNLTKETGNLNSGGDKTIQMDVKIEQAIVHYVKEKNLPFDIYSEEIGYLNLTDDSKYILVFDPLDGSTNYRIGKNMFPYGLLVALYKGTSPKIRDIVSSGAYERTTDQGWYYDGTKTKILANNQSIRLNKKWNINKSTPIHLDLYYKEPYKSFSSLPERIHIRWCGSNISSLLYVLTQTTSAMGALTMKPEEIGTIISLVKGSGGITVNHKGEDLEDQNFSINETYSVLAGNKDVIDFVITQLN